MDDGFWWIPTSYRYYWAHLDNTQQSQIGGSVRANPGNLFGFRGEPVDKAEEEKPPPPPPPPKKKWWHIL